MRILLLVLLKKNNHNHKIYKEKKIKLFNKLKMMKY